MSYPNLIGHIQQYVTLSTTEIELLLTFLQPAALKKKDFLLKEGQVCKGNYFIESGCLRMFFVNEKGVEQITHFAIENWWMADYLSFIGQTPSQFNIQAIENTTVFAVDYQSQEELFRALPQLERYFRMVLLRAYAASQQRIKYVYDLSKEERYLHFTSNFPGFVQRIPQYMMASYLGFTPEYLSEIRKKNTGNNIS